MGFVPSRANLATSRESEEKHDRGLVHPGGKYIAQWAKNLHPVNFHQV